MSDPGLLPPQVFVSYEMPDTISARIIEVDELPGNWTHRQTHFQALGDAWLDSARELLLIVPSVVMPLPNIPDRNVLINHRAADAASIIIASVVPFVFDVRLFEP